MSDIQTTHPQTGPCHLEMWTVVGDVEPGPSRHLGIGRWEDLHGLVDKRGGVRHGNLFQVPGKPGETIIYRATAVTG